MTLIFELGAFVTFVFARAAGATVDRALMIALICVACAILARLS